MTCSKNPSFLCIPYYFALLNLISTATGSPLLADYYRGEFMNKNTALRVALASTRISFFVRSVARDSSVMFSSLLGFSDRIWNRLHHPVIKSLTDDLASKIIKSSVQVYSNICGCAGIIRLSFVVS